MIRGVVGYARFEREKFSHIYCGLRWILKAQHGILCIA